MTDSIASLRGPASRLGERQGQAAVKHHVTGMAATIEYRTPRAVRPIALPTVQPGQLWLVELPPTEPKLSPLEYRVLTTANVLIYDRGLAPAVARFLPLGGYAEPASQSGGVSDMGWERCVRFAMDGWSVARLIEPSAKPGGLAGPERVEKIRRLSEQAPSAKRLAERPVLIFANIGDGDYERSETTFDELIYQPSFAEARALTIVFRGIDAGVGPRFCVASTNGLAG